MAKIKRSTYRLTPEECAIFRRLLPQESVAFSFWKRIAEDRKIDYQSIIGNEHDRESFTALPLKHGKHWCWPQELKCSRPPIDFPYWVSA